MPSALDSELLYFYCQLNFAKVGYATVPKRKRLYTYM